MIMIIYQRRVKISKIKRKVDEDDNVFIGYYCADEIGNIFNYINYDIQSYNIPLKKNNNLHIQAMVGSTIFSAIQGERILNTELRDL